MMLLVLLLLLGERGNRHQNQHESQSGTKFRWTHEPALSDLKYLDVMLFLRKLTQIN